MWCRQPSVNSEQSTLHLTPVNYKKCQERSITVYLDSVFKPRKSPLCFHFVSPLSAHFWIFSTLLSSVDANLPRDSMPIKIQESKWDRQHSKLEEVKVCISMAMFFVSNSTIHPFINTLYLSSERTSSHLILFFAISVLLHGSLSNLV